MILYLFIKIFFAEITYAHYLRMFSALILLLIFPLINQAHGALECPCSGPGQNAGVTPCIKGRCSLDFTDEDFDRLLTKLSVSQPLRFNISMLKSKEQSKPACAHLEVETLSNDDIVMAFYDPLWVGYISRGSFLNLFISVNYYNRKKTFF